MVSISQPLALTVFQLQLQARGKFTILEHELHTDYDVVVLANVMHHIPAPERQVVIDKLTRRLADSGRLVIFEHNPANPLTRWAVSHCAFDKGVILVWPRQLQRYLVSAGLRVLHRDYIVFFPRYLARLRPLEPKLAWCPLGAQFVITALKPTCSGMTTSRRRLERSDHVLPTSKELGNKLIPQSQIRKAL